MTKNRVWCILLCIILLSTCSAVAETPSAGPESATPGNSAISSLDDLAYSDIAVQTGMICDVLTQERIEGTKIQYFNSQTDAMMALQTGKVQGWCCDEPVARYMILTHPNMKILKEPLAASNLAAVFPKTDAGKELCDEFSTFVDQLWHHVGNR